MAAVPSRSPPRMNSTFWTVLADDSGRDGGYPGGGGYPDPGGGGLAGPGGPTGGIPPTLPIGPTGAVGPSGPSGPTGPTGPAAGIIGGMVVAGATEAGAPAPATRRRITASRWRRA